VVIHGLDPPAEGAVGADGTRGMSREVSNAEGRAAVGSGAAVGAVGAGSPIGSVGVGPATFPLPVPPMDVSHSAGGAEGEDIASSFGE
jgi:hypothetical protein